MSYLDEYNQAMDFVRERYGLPASVSMYEAVVKVVRELKEIEDKLQKLEKSCQKKPNQSLKQQSKSQK